MKTISNTSELKSRSEQLSTGNRAPVNFEKRRVNRSLTAEKLLAVLRKDAPRLFELAEVVGKWVWIAFPDKQPSEVTRGLAELGFHWNNARQAWQHPCGLARERAPFDPRKKYRSYFAADTKTA